MIIDDIKNKTKWTEFLTKLETSVVTNKKLIKEVKTIIENGSYVNYVDELQNNTFFDTKAIKYEIPKSNSKTKRSVYSYSFHQTILLKFVNFLLRDYDYLFANNLSSYRANKKTISVVRHIYHLINNKDYYAYKVDIHDYFRSINKDILKGILKDKINDDLLLSLFYGLLDNDTYYFNNELIKEYAGAVPGMPLSGFFANLYMTSIDTYFEKEGINYYRYADDIIILEKDQTLLNQYALKLKEMIYSLKLTINNKKEFFYKPGDKLEFLGFNISKNYTDISDTCFKKIKMKLKRSARSFRRWMLKNNLPYERALKGFNKKFNKKFYGIEKGEVSWIIWYFPCLTTTETIHQIDLYYQQEARYIKTGRHSKMNYKEVPYETLKEYGYRPLMASYYEFKNKK